MSLKKGDLVKIAYEGKISRTGEVFDTTNSKKAKEIGLRGEAKPRKIILGANMVISGLENEILKHSEGDEFDVTIQPKNAFGSRKRELVKTFSKKMLQEQNVNPYPGLMIQVEGMQAKVLSVNGGRVRLDFNNPMSGKTVDYHVKITKKISDKKEYVNALLDHHLGRTPEKIKIENKKASIKMEKELPKQVTEKLSEEIKKYTNLKANFEKNRNEKKSGKKSKSSKSSSKKQ